MGGGEGERRTLWRRVGKFRNVRLSCVNCVWNGHATTEKKIKSVKQKRKLGNCVDGRFGRGSFVLKSIRLYVVVFFVCYGPIRSRSFFFNLSHFGSQKIALTTALC